MGSRRPPAILPRRFFDRPAIEVAPQLLGCVVRHASAEGCVAIRLTEVEAYLGELDPGSHAFRGKTARNAVMFGEPGHVYVYFTYGMHYCMNLVCQRSGIASAVLLRAGEVVEGAELAAVRRPGARPRDLARGPARLVTALGLGGADNGSDACDPASALQVIERTGERAPVLAGPRVGLRNGADHPWRFWLDGEPTVSAYRPHVPKRRPSGRSPNPSA